AARLVYTIETPPEGRPLAMESTPRTAGVKSSIDPCRSSVANGRRPALWPFAPLAVVVVLVGLAYAFGLQHHLSFETLIRNRAAIDLLVEPHSAIAATGYVLTSDVA